MLWQAGIYLGGDSPQKMTEVLIGNFEKNPLKGTRILISGHGPNSFSPLRGTSLSSGETYISKPIFLGYLLNTLKGNAITLPEVILYYGTLSGTN